MANDRAGDEDDSSIPLPPSANAPAIARTFVEERSGDLAPALVDDALVLVSELVTNAVLHGQPEIRLRLRRIPPGIGVAVSDEGDDLDQVRPSHPSARATSGRGLAIVDTLAADWGVQAGTPGKVVWFELRS